MQFKRTTDVWLYLVQTLSKNKYFIRQRFFTIATSQESSQILPNFFTATP